MENNTYHIPVLIKETVVALSLKPKGVYADVTFGGGGHSTVLLETEPSIRVVGFDWDKEAIEHGQQLVEDYEDRLTLIWGSFSHLYKLIKKHKLPAFDGILADFGTSQFQIAHAPGFSVHHDTALDMRMSTSHFKTTAADVVNQATLEELCEIFWNYGEERNAKKIAQKIVEVRAKQRITTTQQLAQLVEKVVPRTQKIHPATRIFQALRIFVNEELDNITAFLPAAFEALKPGGRLVCISFHSLEDRIVKQFFKERVAQQEATEVVRGIVTPSDDEVAHNPASRSAKLRVIEKR